MKTIVLILSLVSISAHAFNHFPSTGEIFDVYDLNHDEIIDYKEHTNIFDDYFDYFEECLQVESKKRAFKVYIYVADEGKAPQCLGDKISALMGGRKDIRSSRADISKVVKIAGELCR